MRLVIQAKERGRGWPQECMTQSSYPVAQDVQEWSWMAVRAVADFRPSAVTSPGTATSIDHDDLVHSVARQEGDAAATDRRSEADLFSAHVPSAYCSNTWNGQEVHLPAYSGRSFPGR